MRCGYCSVVDFRVVLVSRTASFVVVATMIHLFFQHI